VKYVRAFYSERWRELSLRFKAGDIEYSFDRGGLLGFGYIGTSIGRKSAEDMQKKADKIADDYLAGKSGEIATWFKLMTLTRRYTTLEHIYLPLALFVSVFIAIIVTVVKLETY